MRPDLETHALLRIAGAEALVSEIPLPPWVSAELQRAPWVVVRRAHKRNGLIPVGVRGRARAERCAAWLRPATVLECLNPLQLAARRDWHEHPRRDEVAALAAMDIVEAIMRRQDLASRWGPSGSLGFEFASGCATATRHSDVDLVMQVDQRMPIADATALLTALAQLPVRADVLLEMSHGAVALAEYARARAPFLLRTLDGPRLVEEPWASVAAA